LYRDIPEHHFRNTGSGQRVITRCNFSSGKRFNYKVMYDLPIGESDGREVCATCDMGHVLSCAPRTVYPIYSSNIYRLTDDRNPETIRPRTAIPYVNLHTKIQRYKAKLHEWNRRKNLVSVLFMSQCVNYSNRSLRSRLNIYPKFRGDPFSKCQQPIKSTKQPIPLT